MTKPLDVLPGDRYGRLIVVREVEKHIYPSGDTRRKFLMRCDCGSEPKSYLISDIRRGHTKSCGCIDKEQKTTHGMHNTRQYQSWADMKTRCDNPSHKCYPDYGGRGITYDPKWSTFDGFWEDMCEGYSDDLTLNRRDVEKGYCKENCAWDDKHFQGHMRRKMKGTLLKGIGVYPTPNSRYGAAIKIKSSRQELGRYDTEQEAVEAYDMVSELVYGDRPNKTVETRQSVSDRVLIYLAKSEINVDQ